MKKLFFPHIFFGIIMLAAATGCDKFMKKEEDPAETEARSQREKAMRTARNYEDAWNRRDAKAVAAMYAEDATIHMSDSPKPVQGRAEIEKMMEDFFRAFPDLQSEAITTVAEGNKFVVEGRMTGTNSGPMRTEQGEVPATNRKVDLRYVMVATLNDSLITEDRTYFNPQEMEKQLFPNGKSDTKVAKKKKKKR